MADKKCKIDKVYPIPKDVVPNKTWGSNFSSNCGFAVNVLKEYWMSVFVDQRLTVDDVKQQNDFLASGEILCHCISCIGEDWEVHSEPISKKRAGIILRTSKGKALASGTASIDTKGNLSYNLIPVYPGVTNKAKMECTGQGQKSSKGDKSSGSTGGWSISVSVTVSGR